ncbi:MAG: periplasmic heavy metal sensor [Acidobacteria bacterium]|nr:periplasmic heavy metal sensor [Acidobacteriota bacterium]
MNHLRRVLLGLAVLLVPVLAAAQASPAPPPPGAGLGKWWKNSEIVRELGLSEAQTNQIEQVFFEQRLKLIDLRAELERQETRLQPLIEADQPDEAKVSAQIDQVLAARGRLEKANAMMMLAIRRVLSVEQWKKLQSLQEKHHQRFPRGAPRAPLGPPPPGAPPHRPPDEEL